MTRWIDIPALQSAIAAEAKARAMAAGLEDVQVRVVIAPEPDRRGHRVIDVEVSGERPVDTGDDAADRFRLLELT